jgi:hypothetical protein
MHADLNEQDKTMKLCRGRETAIFSVAAEKHRSTLNLCCGIETSIFSGAVETLYSRFVLRTRIKAPLPLAAEPLVAPCEEPFSLGLYLYLPLALIAQSQLHNRN